MDSTERSNYNKTYYQKKKAMKPRDERERKIFFPLRMPETLVAQLQRMAAEGIVKGTYAWKSASEAARGLIFLGLKRLYEEGDELALQHFPAIELHHQLDGIHQAQREAMSALGKSKTAIGSLLEIGAKREALQYYHATLETAKKMPATVWADWLIEEMEKAFPELKAMKVIGVRLGGKKGKGKRR